MIRTVLFSIVIAGTILFTAQKCMATPQLEIGQTAPDFKLIGDDNKHYQLSDYNDQNVVLFFYPLDNSPDCTEQACSINNSNAIYAKHNIRIFGINFQSPEHHAEFKKQHNLNYILLSDEDKKVSRAYGASSWLVLVPKRITILISKGKIVAILNDIDVAKHDKQVLEGFGVKDS